MFDFAVASYTNKNLQRLSKRLVQSCLDMLRFLKYPTLAWNNNLAERMIRPNVIYRNRSFGNRSELGAQAHGTLMSLMQTLRLQGKTSARIYALPSCAIVRATRLPAYRWRPAKHLLYNNWTLGRLFITHQAKADYYSQINYPSFH